jgi:hypothetical protein
MKKIYNKPEMETLVIKSSHQLLAGSEKQASGETPSEWGAPGFDFEE